MTKLCCQATTLWIKRERGGQARQAESHPRASPSSQVYLLPFIFSPFPLKFHTDRYTRTLLQLKVPKWNIAAIFLWRRVAYKFTSPKVSLTLAIHQTMQPHQSESIRNYSPSKLHWKALICYWSLLLFSSILKDWKQKSNNVTVIVKCNFYWDWWEPICHNICF